MTTKSEEKSNSIFPEYMFKDPVLTFFSLLVLPLILLTQSINTSIMAGVPKITSTATETGYYKNDEEWELYEKAGKIVIKVHRNAQRK